MLRKSRAIAQYAKQGIKSALSETTASIPSSSSSSFTSAASSSSLFKTPPTNLSLLHIFKSNFQKQTTRSQWTDGRGYTHFRRPSRFTQLEQFSGRGGNNGQNPQGKRNVTLLLVAGAGGTIIYFSSLQEIPYSKRKHSILIDVDTERQMGAETFEQVLAEARANRALLSPNHPASLAVKRVGGRIAAVAGDGYGGGFVDQMKGIKWEFAVIQSNQANAFVVPGGKVVVYTGLLRMLSNEDELAAVLAHEVGHIVARHAAERITQGSVIELFRFLAYIFLGIPIPSGAIAAAFFLPNSRKAETEADAIGIQLAARACYDPRAAAVVFAKLGQMEKKEGLSAMPKFLRTHPVTTDRINNINKMLATAENLYVSSGCDDKRGLLTEFQARLGATIRPIDWSIIHKSV